MAGAIYQGGLPQFLNPKAWLMTISAVASFSLAGEAYAGSVIAISIGIAAVNIVLGAVWLVFGTVIGRLLKRAAGLDAFQSGHGTADCGLRSADCCFGAQPVATLMSAAVCAMLVRL